MGVFRNENAAARLSGIPSDSENVLEGPYCLETIES